MGAGTGISWSTTLFEVIGFWLIILLVIFLFIKGILKGTAQKRYDKLIELEKRIEMLEKQIDKE
ncbi:hypothetical protein [Gottfriedia solisilvae]|uniref:DUF4083 domain-containing protein n=1 Tax=Gottfriedia solisilvae TaxID=1516104 RepID=A0A8J3AJ36_9BACI|nr:hypothetical protein [Gottfriedia solisilvae]GGI11532.1 hypothetical protein GCM10007380_08310 [Gottfriedia solisilvae]